MEYELTRNIGPPWYQVLSISQMEAADGLFEGLRDDLEQGTVHRCTGLLRQIGIYPLKSSKNIQCALEMSRGNDLAFLWFLNEMFYSQSTNLATTQEFSINERLLISSICHLDMITTLRELDRILPPMKLKKKRTIAPPIKSCKCRHFSPYLDPMPLPKIPESFPLPPPPVPGPNFKPYLIYKDPDFVVNNESNRWYSKPGPIKTTSPSPITKCLMNRKIDSPTEEQEEFDRAAVISDLCMKHKNIEEKRRDLLANLVDATKCVGEFGSDTHDVKDLLRGKVVHQIELDTARTKEEFEELAKRYQNQTIVKTLIRQLIENSEDIHMIKSCRQCRDSYDEYLKYQEIERKNQIEDSGENSGVTCLGKGNFFKISASSKKCPYSLDYEKIFRDNIIAPEDPIKKGLHIALDLDKYASDEDKAIEICMKNLWQLELKLWNEKSIHDDNPEDKEDYDEEGFPISININPRNLRQMRRLLRDALNKMKENPKFVLPTIPKSYDLPILKEWMRVRYGYKYSHEERHTRLMKSRTYWEQLRLLKFKINLPYRNQICRISKLDWNCKDYIETKVRDRLQTFYKELNFAVIKECRQFWPTMEPFLCTMGPPREVFYAYLPASEYHSVPTRRPWKICDVKNLKK